MLDKARIIATSERVRRCQANRNIWLVGSGRAYDVILYLGMVRFYNNLHIEIYRYALVQVVSW